MVPVSVSSGQIHIMNTLFAAPAERQAWKGIPLSFKNSLQIAMGCNRLTCTAGHSQLLWTPSWLGLWAKRTGSPRTRAKDRSLEQEEILLLEPHLASKPLSPLLPPQLADRSRGGRAHHTFGCSKNCSFRADRADAPWQLKTSQVRPTREQPLMSAHT